MEGFMMLSSKNGFGHEYASLDDSTFIPKYRAACFCGKVRYEVSAELRGCKILSLQSMPDTAWRSDAMGCYLSKTSRAVYCRLGSFAFLQ
jgi:hypothetical protein